jgi:hypothetical protein
LKEYYNDEYKIDFFNKNKLWQCSPIFMDFNLLHFLSILKLFNQKKENNEKKEYMSIITFNF